MSHGYLGFYEKSQQTERTVIKKHVEKTIFLLKKPTPITYLMHVNYYGFPPALFAFRYFLWESIRVCIKLGNDDRGRSGRGVLW